MLMKEKYLYDGKVYMLNTYFIIHNNFLYSTNNFAFEALSDCFYIKKMGSTTHYTPTYLFKY